MQIYLNRNGKSGISAYEIGTDYISVQFSNGKIYTYSYTSAGSQNVEIMKELAQNGYGLNSYIMKNVKNNYVR
ncbi:MAG: hypothetical protein AB8E82_08700 [Aureispira sp.]